MQWATRVSPVFMLVVALAAVGCFNESGLRGSDLRAAERAAGLRFKYVPYGEKDLIFPVETGDGQLRLAAAHLKESGVTRIDLSSTSITAASVDALSPIRSLESINVAFTALAPEDIERLATTLTLKSIIVGNGPFSDADVERMRQAIAPTVLGGTFWNRRS